MEFYDHRHAAASLAAMNGRKIMGKVSYRVYRVSWDGWAVDTGDFGCASYLETKLVDLMQLLKQNSVLNLLKDSGWPQSDHSFTQ